jgi:hypothetical protein
MQRALDLPGKFREFLTSTIDEDDDRQQKPAHPACSTAPQLLPHWVCASAIPT